MLKNPAYIGQAAYGRTRAGPLQPRLRPQRGNPLVPRRAISTIHLPREEWITIAVPALIEPELFEAVSEQLRENQERVRQQRRGARFLLQGLITCRRCRYAYYGKATHWKDRQGRMHEYAYYRCSGTDGHRFGGEQVCDNRELRVEGLDGAIWQTVCEVLEHPRRIAQEYQQRAHALEGTAVAQQLRTAQAQLSKVRHGIARLIDSYAEGLIEKVEFEPRVLRLRERVAELEAQVHQLGELAERSTDIEQIIGCLEEFANQIRAGLEAIDWSTRRAIIRALVKVIEVDRDEVYVVFRVGANPFELRPEGGIWKHCWRRVY
jgi:site-specific DNA recombinase